MTAAADPRRQFNLTPVNLRTARVAAGFTQRELSRQDNISVDSVRRAERGNAVSIETALQLSRALKVGLSEICRTEHCVYYLPNGCIQRENGRWREYHGSNLFAEFEEFDSDGGYIRLICTRGKSAKGHRMLVRFPNSGGQIEWSWENPLEWIPFNIVKAGSGR